MNAVSPLDLPRSPGDGGDVTTDVTTDTTDVTSPSTTLPGDDDQTGDDPVDGVTPANHGACVSAIAHDKSASGREHGRAVPTAAKSDCGKTDDDATTSTTTPTSSTTSIPGDETADPTSNRGPGPDSGHGNSGNSGNQGNGYGGSNSGKK